MRAVFTGLDMTTERSSSTQFDGRHDAAFHAADMTVMSLAISVAMAAENIRHLQIGTHRCRSGRWHHLKGQTIERALRAGDRACRHMGVARRRRQVAVSQQNLDDPDIRTVLQ